MKASRLSNSISGNPNSGFQGIPNSGAVDRLLLQLAMNVLHLGGHRYGAFLDAAMTAAKCAIYASYLEHGKSFRKTGLLHHVEPKRVKTIVQEVQAALNEGKFLKTLASQEPQYLICFPHLWQKKYPWIPGQPRLSGDILSAKERQQIEKQLPENLPPARLINLFELTHLIECLHSEVEEYLPVEQQTCLSEPLMEHIKLRLLYSGTVIQLDAPRGFPLYALARTAYSPKDRQERVYTMIEDVACFFRLMQDWVQQQPNVLRGVETFDVEPGRETEALQELDTLIQAWADKYHCKGGNPMVLHMVVGSRKD